MLIKKKDCTAAIYSITKKRAGTFATQGIHIGQNVPFPLPLMGIVGESTDDVAMQIDFAFEILAATKGTTAKELYKNVDVHMTDSTDHNKGIAEVLSEIYNLDSKAGQIFCGSHTTLGFAREMNKITALIEADMKLDAILAHFMVDIAPDSKHDSIAGQALDMALKLVAPEYDNKMWNKQKLNRRKNLGIKTHLNINKNHHHNTRNMIQINKQNACNNTSRATIIYALSTVPRITATNHA